MRFFRMSSVLYSRLQQYFIKTQRCLVLIQTITKFEEHFRYPLWENKVEYLANLLKIERGRGYETDEEADENIEAANKNAANENTVNENAANENAVNKDAANEDAVNKDTANKNAANENAADH